MKNTETPDPVKNNFEAALRILGKNLVFLSTLWFGFDVAPDKMGYVLVAGLIAQYMFNRELKKES